MSERDDDGDARRDAFYERRRRRWATRCLCGYPDMPGHCPGAANCPMHGEQPPED
jgi:hypothetical protein